MDKEIARELNITIDTVRTYWRRIRSKVGNFTRPQLAARFVEISSEADRERLSHEMYEHITAEILLREVADLCPVGILVRTQANGQTFANRAWRELDSQSLDFDSASEWIPIQPGELGAMVNDLVDKCADRFDDLEGEYHARRPDGICRTINVRCKRITSGDQSCSASWPLAKTLRFKSSSSRKPRSLSVTSWSLDK